MGGIKCRIGLRWAQAAQAIAALLGPVEQRVRERIECLANANGELEQVAGTDPLTGPPSRHACVETATAVQGRAQRSGQRMPILLRGIDRLKIID